LMTMRNDVGADTFAEALVEDKIFTYKFVFQTPGLYLPGVLDNTALKLEHIFKTAVFHVSACFFAANTAGAIHQDVFVFLTGEKIGYHRKFFTKGGSVGRDGILKMPDFALVVVAHVHHDCVGVVRKAVPMLGVEVCARVGRVEIGTI